MQEQLKKLRKVAQGAEPGSTTASAKSTPVATPTKAKAARKAPAATPAGGVKKTRKPAAAGGRGKKAKAAAAAAVKAGTDGLSFLSSLCLYVCMYLADCVMNRTCRCQGRAG